MATFTVTTLTDELNAGASLAAPGGSGLSLREAILLAEGTTGADTITFAPSLSGGTVFIDPGLLSFQFDAGQDVVVDGDLNNDGVADITLSGDTNQNGFPDGVQTRIIDVLAADANVTLEGLILDRGFFIGDGNSISVSTIINFGTLTLTNTDITNALARTQFPTINQPGAAPGANGTPGAGGADGEDGRITGGTLFPIETPPTDGADGTDGGDGANAVQSGVSGANGEDVTHVINFGTLTFNDVDFINNNARGETASFGGAGANGGNGGNGGFGGNGGLPATFNGPAGSGGNGGDGGNGGAGTNGGSGGSGGDVASIINLGTVTANTLTFLANTVRGSDGGNGGIAGVGGAAGLGGIGGLPGGFNSATGGDNGSDGLRGVDGAGGRGGDGGDAAAILNIGFGSITGNAIFANTSSIEAGDGGFGGAGGTGNSIDGADGDAGLVINRDAANSNGFTTNSEPVAADDDFATDENTVVTGNLFADNGNGADIDVDGNALEVLSVSEINRPDGPPNLYLNQSGLATFGIFTVAPNGDFTFDPTAGSIANVQSLREGETVTQTFFYRITDNVAPTAPLLPANASAGGGPFAGVTGQITFVIAGRNDAPVDEDETITLTATSNTLSQRLNLLDNATDVDAGDTLQLGQAISFSQPPGTPAVFSFNTTSGEFQWDLAGNLTDLYTDENLTYSYFYSVNDGNGGGDSSALRIIVNGANNRPTAADDQFNIDAGGNLFGNVFIDNGNGADTDADGDTLKVFSVAEANLPGDPALLTSAGGPVAFGILSVDENGNFSLDTDGNGNAIALGVGETATQTFFYRITDLATASEPVLGALNPIAEQGASDSIGRVQVTIMGVNDGPTANNDSVFTDEDTAISGNVLADNGNGADSDPDTNDAPTVTEINGVAALIGSQFFLSSGALLTLNEDGAFDYNPNGAFESLDDGETATDSFSYTIDDGNGGTDIATVTLTVNGVNDRPTAQNDEVSTPEDMLLSGNLFDDNGNGIDFDAEGDGFTIFSVAEANRNDDQAFFSALGQFTVFGMLQVDPNGDYTFDPTGSVNADALGIGETATLTILYRITDEATPSEPLLVGADLGRVGSVNSIGRLDITITGVNDAPAAEDDALSTDEDTAFSGSVFADNGNGVDSDADANDVFTVTEVNGGAANIGQAIMLPSGAVLTLNSDGSFDYDPNDAFEGLANNETDTEIFTYTIDDGNGGTDTATATVTINGVNDAPVADDDTLRVGEDSSASINLLGNDLDLDLSDVLFIASNTAGIPFGLFVNTVTTMGGRELPILILRGDGSNGGPIGNNLIVAPTNNDAFDELAAGETDSFTFDYTVSDRNGGADTATATVIIEGVNDAPDAMDDDVVTDRGIPVVVSVLDNDTDIDVPDVLTVTSSTNGSNGITAINADGTVTYMPNAGFAGVDNFTYTIDDGNGGADTASVDVIVRNLDGANSRDLLVGDNDGNEINGLRGNDTVLALGGNDTVDGGGGRDMIEGGDGRDLIDGAGGADMIDGGEGRDTIDGGSGSDNIDGGAGNDDIMGGAGSDTIDGGEGNDDIDAGSGADRVDAGNSRDTVDGGSGSDMIDGGDGRDSLDGGTGNDMLMGGAGRDTLNGGAGNDKLEGGSGPDTFIFEGVFGNDRILDFNINQDTLDFGATDPADLTFIQQGANTLIRVAGRGSSVRVDNADADDLAALFAPTLPAAPFANAATGDDDFFGF